MSRFLLIFLMAASSGGLAACNGEDSKEQPVDTDEVDTDVPEPAAPVPTVLTGNAVPGEPLELELRDRDAGEVVRVWFGGTLAAEPVCEGDVCVDLSGAVELPSVTADGDGVAHVLIPLPADVSDRVVLQLAGPGWRSTVVSLAVSPRLPWFGVWVDDYGGAHEVDHQTVRDDYGTFHVLRFDAAERWLLARNDAANEFNAGLYSRFDWVEVGGVLWYCQSAFDAASEEDALAASANADDPATGGCGGFPWSQLTPGQPDIGGGWQDTFGASHVIDAVAWSQPYGVWLVSRFSNFDRVIIAQNGPDNEYFPGLWSRFDWSDAGGYLWYCQTVFDAADEWTARSAAPADDTDPGAGGCAGFAWTGLTL